MFLVHESWDLDLGVDLALGFWARDLRLWNVTLTTGPLDLGSGIGSRYWELELRLCSAPET